LALLSENALPRWGVGVTAKNKRELMKLAEEARRMELEKREAFPRLEQMARPPMRIFIEERMAPLMGLLANDAAKTIAEKRDEIRLLDLPARNGLTSGQIMIQMDPEISGITTFHLVDYSETNIRAATNNMKARGARGYGHSMLDTEYLDTSPDGCFDIIVTLSHLHHQSFLVDYLMKVHRVLKDDGILIIGDRYSAMLDHPKHTFELLPEIGADPATIRAFLEFYGEDWLKGEPCKLEPEELQAIDHHKEYLLQISKSVKQNSMDTSLEKVCSNEAYETSAARKKKLDKANFTTDPAAIRRAFPSLKNHELPKRMMRGRDKETQKERTSDFATVMVAVKKKG
jgi:SAM-dependent methyltransferase